MLLNLHVKNIALIDDVEIDFRDGLNILTGETGAGKSLIIDSVNFALGKRMPKDVVREDAEYALCELAFSIDNDEIREALRELEIPVDNDEVILQRKLMNGRSTIRVNGESASASLLKELALLLIDIHGQHEHQSLSYKKKHREILDSYCGSELISITDNISGIYSEYNKLVEELDEAANSDKNRDKEIALASFEINEIENASLKEGEDETLETEYRKLANARKIAEAVAYAHQCCSYEGESAAGASVGRALSKIRQVAEYDEELSGLANELADIDALLNDFNRSIAAYESELEVSPERFNEVEERLDLINHLKNKYGDSIVAINEYKEKQQALLDKYSDYDAYLAALKSRVDETKAKLIKECDRASKIRQAEAKILSAKIREALIDLNFLEANFEVSVIADEKYLSSNGYDDVEFMISTNPGEKIRPMTEVASGGELSRIMLALKSVLADKDSVGTLIFDEIDTGISGRTAQKVSEKLKQLARRHQIICITHLPQIAAMADEHFEIRKEVDGNRTHTIVEALSEEASVRELARMLGGAEITENVINSAKEMKALANNLKK